jgi:DNA-binding CsgD family transcriptional regulator
MNTSDISKEEYLKRAKQFGLTKRELELGYLKISGFSNRRIAYMYGISEQTVKNHFTHIYEKAWVPGRNEFRELFMLEELLVCSQSGSGAG